jgi:hypothetical protein
MNKAYPYIRWSSKRQTHGDSLRRQTEDAESYARSHSLELDNSTYQDHGISAFRGKNIDEGKLGAFLKAIDDGVIKTPCHLIVEALDGSVSIVMAPIFQSSGGVKVWLMSCLRNMQRMVATNLRVGWRTLQIGNQRASRRKPSIRWLLSAAITRKPVVGIKVCRICFLD